MAEQTAPEPTTTAPQPLPLNDVAEVAPIVETFPDYGLSWLVYIGLAVLLMALVWWALRKRHFILKWFVVSVLAAGALTPIVSADNTTTLAPAAVVAVLEMEQQGVDGIWRGAIPIITTWLGLLFFGYLGYFLWSRRKSKAATTESASEPVADESERKDPEID